jgi:dihydrodipicolinate synthase/N-acetylneuraminate lyase
MASTLRGRMSCPHVRAPLLALDDAEIERIERVLPQIRRHERRAFVAVPG